MLSKPFFPKAFMRPVLPPLMIHALTTRRFLTGEALANFVLEHIPTSLIQDGMILVATSKIVSLSENRLVAKDSIDKASLINREADRNLGPIGYGSILTIKEGLFIASAGIDESNSENGDYILYPSDPFASAKGLWSDLRSKWKIKNLGVLLTDSRTTPLRLGVTGVSLAYWGFSGLQDKVGSRDLFGRALQMTKINVADGLASAATLMMGEGNESRPLAVIHGADVDFTTDTNPSELRVALEEDLYYPFFKTGLSE